MPGACQGPCQISSGAVTPQTLTVSDLCFSVPNGKDVRWPMLRNTLIWAEKTSSQFRVWRNRTLTGTANGGQVAWYSIDDITSKILRYAPLYNFSKKLQTLRLLFLTNPLQCPKISGFLFSHPQPHSQVILPQCPKIPIFYNPTLTWWVEGRE